MGTKKLSHRKHMKKNAKQDSCTKAKEAWFGRSSRINTIHQLKILNPFNPNLQCKDRQFNQSCCTYECEQTWTRILQADGCSVSKARDHVLTSIPNFQAWKLTNPWENQYVPLVRKKNHVLDKIQKLCLLDHLLLQWALILLKILLPGSIIISLISRRHFKLVSGFKIYPHRRLPSSNTLILFAKNWAVLIFVLDQTKETKPINTSDLKYTILPVNLNPKTNYKIWNSSSILKRAINNEIFRKIKEKAICSWGFHSISRF